ncbi:NPL/P60 family secreted protein [Streptomyces zinciresistens K42]|uniref:NPL/P60 family secreted protein n=1 Tax=Streptomyces zinciresistens K42 TaxID=700597 RepID=G2GIP5_9ACTN|nr:C40 family peptidase [Streptomyces zinciresistens]EGX56620.1 NPL/P60 family secreted protein [Streptomyces zinciresistens K42]
MAAHRKPRPRRAGGTSARTAWTIVLAGTATTTGLDGTALAEPQQTPAQVKAQVDELYRQAETATEKYNGAKERADAAQRRVNALQDEAARKTQTLNSAREQLGSMAAAQYRDGGLDPALQLALSGDPDRYLDGAEFAGRVGHRQAASVARVRSGLREIEQLRGAARLELTSLASRRTELKRHQRTITGKLDSARTLLARLPSAERPVLGADATSRSPTGTRGTQAAPAPGAATAEAPNSRAAAAISYARSKLGSPYVWGATGPDAFDCSGLTQAAFRAAGVSLPRTTYAQIDTGRRVSRAELLPGDLVFFYSGISHVGLYIGGGRMIHSPNPSSRVRVAPISEMPFAGATRVV